MKDDQEKSKIDEEASPDIHSADTITREKAAAAGNENCSVCSTIPAPVDTMVVTKNGRVETTVTDDVGPYAMAWERKNFCRTLFDFFRGYFPCMKCSHNLHVHEGMDDTNFKGAFTDDGLRHNSTASNAYIPFNEMDIDVQSDLQILVHTPSYYMATREKAEGVNIPYNTDRTSKVLTLPLEQIDDEDQRRESIATTESGGQSSYRSKDSALKRSYSDSAISIPMTNSTCASSFTNSPLRTTNADNMNKQRYDYKLSKRTSRESSFSNKNNSIDEGDEDKVENDLNIEKLAHLGDKRGSIETYMDDCFEKIRSLPRDENGSQAFREFLNISTVEDSHIASSESESEHDLSWNDMAIANEGKELPEYIRTSQQDLSIVAEAGDNGYPDDSIELVEYDNPHTKLLPYASGESEDAIYSAQPIKSKTRDFYQPISSSNTDLNQPIECINSSTDSSQPVRSICRESDSPLENGDKGYCYFVPQRKDSYNGLNHSHSDGVILQNGKDHIPQKQSLRLTRQNKIDHSSQDFSSDEGDIKHRDQNGDNTEDLIDLNSSGDNDVSDGVLPAQVIFYDGSSIIPLSPIKSGSDTGQPSDCLERRNTVRNPKGNSLAGQGDVIAIRPNKHIIDSHPSHYKSTSV